MILTKLNQRCLLRQFAKKHVKSADRITAQERLENEILNNVMFDKTFKELGKYKKERTGSDIRKVELDYIKSLL